MTDNLRLKVSTYHARVAVPPELRKALGKYELTKSLKTGSKNLANVRKHEVLAEWRKLFDKMRNEQSQPFDFEEKAFEYTKEIEALDTESIIKITKESVWLDYSHTVEGMLQTQLFFFQSSFEQKQMSKSQFEFLKEFFKEWKAKWFKPENFSTDENGTKTNLEMAEKITAYKEFTSIFNQLAEKEITHNGSLKAAESERVKEILVNPKTFSNKTVFTEKRLSDFSEYQKNTRKVIDKTVDMQVSRLKKLKDYLKQEQKDLSYKSVYEFLDSLTDLSAKTKKQYVLAGNTFYKYAIRHDEEFQAKFANAKPPFQDHEFPVARTGKAQKEGKRKSFTVKNVEDIYENSLTLKGKNKRALTDLIMLGAYTGMRIEEICKIEIARDLIEEDGVYSFSLNDGKNESSVRVIPIHSKLLPLIDRLKKESKDGFLLPSPAGNKYGIRSDYLSKAFGRLKTALGFDSRFVFHSVRATVITSLQRANVATVVIQSVVGHETGLVTYDVYSEGASAAQKQEAIEKLSYNFP